MKGKTHYAYYDPPNESTSFGEWGDPVCGCSSENTTQYENEVTCKHCLRIINKPNPTTNVQPQNNSQ